METKRGAIWALEQGFKVFPLVEGGKVPAVDGWQEWAANSNADTVTEFASERPNCNWGVYCGASGITVIDVDNKGDKNGADTLTELQKQQGNLPPTTVVTTPSGGYHIYYKGEAPTSVDGLGSGLDTRGIGGYVVAPFSVINGKQYQFSLALEIPQIPAWVVGKLREAKKEKKNLEDGEMIKTGERNNFLASVAGTMRERGASRETILSALLTMNRTQLEEPLPETDIHTIADSIARYKPTDAVVASEFAKPVKLMAITGDKIDFGALKPRPWVMQDRYVGGIVSAVIAPGGVGKSTVALLDALAVCTGKPLTGFEVKKKGNVWLYNTEDPLGELELRLAAMCVTHNVTPEERAGLHLTSGRDVPLILAKKGKNGIAVNEEAIKAAIDYIKQQNIVLLIVDPFVRSHEVDENDNMQIDKVIWCFQRIMDATGCAVCVVHHTNKSAYNVTSPEEKMHTGRGASSLVYAARIAHVLTPMKEEEATKFSIPQSRRRWYVRLDNAKANLQAPAESARWFEKVSVDLMIGESVGAIRPSNVNKVMEALEEAERQRRRLDLAKALYEAGLTFPITLSDAYKGLCKHPTFAELMDGKKSERRGTDYIRALMEHDSLDYNKFRFTYVHRDDTKAKRWIVAEKINDF